MELVIESGVLSTEHILNVLARLNAAPVPESIENSLPLLSCELKLFLPQLTASEGGHTFWANSETNLLQSRLK